MSHPIWSVPPVVSLGCSASERTDFADGSSRTPRTLTTCRFTARPSSLRRLCTTAKRGRTTEQLGAISGALTLLANIVMAWNTHRLQSVLDRALAAIEQGGFVPRKWTSETVGDRIKNLWIVAE